MKYLARGAPARRARRRGQRVPRARASSATGFRRRPARRCSARNITRPLLPREGRRRPRLPERGAEGPDRARAGRGATSSTQATAGFEELRARARGAADGRAARARGLDARRRSRRSRARSRAADRGVLVWSMGITQHAHGGDTVRAIANLGAPARVRRAPGHGADADPRALGRAGRRGDGRLRDGAARAACRSTPASARASRGCGASRCRRDPGLTTVDALEAARARRDRRALLHRRELPRDDARSRGGSRRRSARIPLRDPLATSCVTSPDARRARGHASTCSPRARATSSGTAARRPPPSAA